MMVREPLFFVPSLGSARSGLKASQAKLPVHTSLGLGDNDVPTFSPLGLRRR